MGVLLLAHCAACGRGDAGNSMCGVRNACAVVQRLQQQLGTLFLLKQSPCCASWAQVGCCIDLLWAEPFGRLFGILCVSLFSVAMRSFLVANWASDERHVRGLIPKLAVRSKVERQSSRANPFPVENVQSAVAIDGGEGIHFGTTS